MSLQRALADNNSIVNEETIDMGLDDNGDDWITEDDGESDDTVSSIAFVVDLNMLIFGLWFIS